MPYERNNQLLLEKKYLFETKAGGLCYQVQAWGKPVLSQNLKTQDMPTTQTHRPEQSALFLQQKLQNENPLLRVKMLEQFHSDLSLQIPFTNNKNTSKFVWGKADAVFSSEKNFLCAVRVADCIPVLLWSFEKPLCAAIHAGWRGLHNHIVLKTIARISREFSLSPQSLHAWVGAHIAAESYPVKEDVYKLFAEEDSLPYPLGSDAAHDLKQNKKQDNAQRLLNSSLILHKQLLQAGLNEENIMYNTDNVFQSKDWFSHRASEKGRNVFFIHIKK